MKPLCYCRTLLPTPFNFFVFKFIAGRALRIFGIGQVRARARIWPV